MSTYLQIPVIKTSDLISNNEDDIDFDSVPPKYKNIKINQELQIMIKNEQDFINTMLCLTYHMTKYIPFEVYDFATQNRKMCKEIIDSQFTDLFHKELTVLIMTKPDYLIKKCAKHGLFNLLKYATSKPMYPVPDKGCNYAVGSTMEHFKCFEYLFTKYYKQQPIINKFIISKKMARKGIPICYLEFLKDNITYTHENPESGEISKKPCWYTDCAETLVKNNDMIKLQYLCDNGFEFDRFVATVAIQENNLEMLKFFVKNNLPYKEIKNPYHLLFEKKDIERTEEEIMKLFTFMHESKFQKPSYGTYGCFSAAKLGFKSCVQFFIDNGYKVNFNDMYQAVQTGDLEFVKYFHNLVMKQNNNQIHEYYKSTVSSAVEYGLYDILIFLIECGYPLNKIYASRYAKRYGHTKCYEYLISLGCKEYPDLKVKERKNGQTRGWESDSDELHDEW